MIRFPRARPQEDADYNLLFRVVDEPSVTGVGVFVTTGEANSDDDDLTEVESEPGQNEHHRKAARAADSTSDDDVRDTFSVRLRRTPLVDSSAARTRSGR